MAVITDRNGRFDRLRPGFRLEPGLICHMIAVNGLLRRLASQ